MFEELQGNIKLRNVVIISIAAAILLIISISVIAIVLGPKNEANILNNTTSDKELISDEELSRIKKKVYSHIRESLNADEGPINMKIRWDTVNREELNDGGHRTTMLADIDEYQQTYKISIDDYFVLIGCPTLSETKYPSSFCIGDDGELNDSILTVFGSKLPYEGQTSNGIRYEFSRNSQQPGDHGLKLWVYTCAEDANSINQANQAVNDFIASFGAPSDLFNWNTYTLNCEHSE